MSTIEYNKGSDSDCFSLSLSCIIGREGGGWVYSSEDNHSSNTRSECIVNSVINNY